MARIQNIDKFRGAACLLVVLYHCYALTGLLPFDIPVLRDGIKMGGEVGVTMFFLLSGYGIYFSICRLENKNQLNYSTFLKARIKRIVPQYYFNIAVMLLFTGSAVYLAKEHFWTIVSHLFFFHSWNFGWHGAINGVLWTMSVIFQFYLIAIPLYKLMKKIDNVWIFAAISIAFTILMKWLILNYIWVEDETIYGSYVYFIPGRQIVTSLDNFVCGMCVAAINARRKEITSITKIQRFGAGLNIIIFIILCICAVKYGISGRNIWCYSWYSLLAVNLALLMYDISYTSKNGVISRFLLFISKHEYGIYLWHLPIINNVVNSSQGVRNLIENQNGIVLYIVLLILSVPIGIVIDHFFDNKTVAKKA